MNIYSTILARPCFILIYIMHIWELLVDTIFPPTPHELLVRVATIQEIEIEYRPSQKAGVYYFCNYRRRLIKAVIATAKFSHNKKSITLLTALLTKWLAEHTKTDTILIPIPLHSKRERERGYNQVTAVLSGIRLTHVIIGKNILKKHKSTVPQTTLTKEDRTENLKGAFSVNASLLTEILTPNITQIIICDDVYTTGSTLREAKRILTPHIPRHCTLTCLAWAH